MGMTPDAYFEAFVQDNYFDYVENPGSVRRAFNAAVPASHLADHYFEYYKKKDPERVKDFQSLGKFVEFLCAETEGAFRDVRSIANAYKHLYTNVDPQKSVHSTVESTGAVVCISFEHDHPDLDEIEEDYEVGEQASMVVYRRKAGRGLIPHKQWSRLRRSQNVVSAVSQLRRGNGSWCMSMAHHRIGSVIVRGRKRWTGPQRVSGVEGSGWGLRMSTPCPTMRGRRRAKTHAPERRRAQTLAIKRYRTCSSTTT